MKLTNYISKAIKTFNMVNGNYHLLWCLHWCTSETCDASLAYGGWPLPFHDLVPHSEQDWVQLTHRIMAFIVFTIIMITYIHAVKNYPNNRTVHYGYTAAFILVILQVITGALSIMTNVNLIIALFHALFITYLFGMTTYFIMLMLRSVRSDKQ